MMATMPGRIVFFVLVFCSIGVVRAGNVPHLISEDPHRNELGFFDIHICNWPERPQFLKVLFSTSRFAQIDRMEVFDPAGRKIVDLDKHHFMQFSPKNKPVKRVFMQDIDLPESATEGWYRIAVTDSEGRVYEASDLVPLTRIQRPVGLQPGDGDEEVSVDTDLSWQEVPGAQYYQVFVRDAWSDELLYRSKLIEETDVELPSGTLQPGGYYVWRVHARDLNEHVLLGDFHNGSMSEKAYFSVRE
jgi:hypothetical protein